MNDAIGGAADGDFDTAGIRTPTLVLYGENVPPTLRDVHTHLAVGIGGADVEVTVVPDAGHASNVDNPDFFTGTVREFARRILGRGD